MAPVNRWNTFPVRANYQYTRADNSNNGKDSSRRAKPRPAQPSTISHIFIIMTRFCVFLLGPACSHWLIVGCCNRIDSMFQILCLYYALAYLLPRVAHHFTDENGEVCSGIGERSAACRNVPFITVTREGCDVGGSPNECIGPRNRSLSVLNYKLLNQKSGKRMGGCKIISMQKLAIWHAVCTVKVGTPETKACPVI